MKGLFGIEFIELDSPYRPKSFSGGGVHGNAILTRIDPDEKFRIDLPGGYNWEEPNSGEEFPSRLEPRIGNRFAICAKFTVRNQDLIIGSIHVEDKFTSIADRWIQYQTVYKEFQNRYGSDSKLVIAGDLNTISTFISRLLMPGKKDKKTRIGPFQTECNYWNEEFLKPEGIIDPFSCKDWTFKRTFLYHAKLDWITVKNCEIINKGRGEFNTSDHRPLWVDIAI
jgi:endonuclease/exonuclease/phosphatase family metal-dependent hydrolase